MTDEVFEQIKRSVERLMKEHPEVKRAILFGSRARGDHSQRSDADILLVLDDSPHQRYFDRIPEFAPYFLEGMYDVDIFPYTDVEITRMKAKGNRLVKRALAEGIEISS
jgi:predicted nucleotidyltransferase